MSEVDVVKYGVEDMVFPFESSQPPNVRCGKGRYGHAITIDPTPAYSHDASLTREALDCVAAAFPVDWPVTVSLLPVECTSRTNGATNVDVDYAGPQDANGKYAGRFGNIYLSAKRIPIHPAMTRYLVAHEYGHVVEEWLNERAGNDLHDGQLLEQYRQLRGLEKPRAYGAGEWHRTPGEVFANDFRVLVCGIELEYWPHEGIARPESVPLVGEWWADRVGELDTHAAKAA